MICHMAFVVKKEYRGVRGVGCCVLLAVLIGVTLWGLLVAFVSYRAASLDRYEVEILANRGGEVLMTECDAPWWLRPLCSRASVFQRVTAYSWCSDRATESDFVRIGHFTRLKSLTISCDQAELAGIEHLASLEELGQLAIHGACFDDSVGKCLWRLVNIESLNLGSSSVTNGILADLSGMTKLNYLGLANTRISDAAIEPLAHMTSLDTVDLRYTDVSEEGIQRLRSHRRDLTILY